MSSTLASVPHGPDDHHHVVHFYEGDEFLADTVRQYVTEGLEAGEGVVVIATGPHRQALQRGLEEHGIDPRRVTMFDARETLGHLLVDGMPDWEKFRILVGSILEKCAAASPQLRVRAYGEMVDLLWK